MAKFYRFIDEQGNRQLIADYKTLDKVIKKWLSVFLSTFPSLYLSIFLSFYLITCLYAASWSSVSCGGYHTIAINADGTLWAWGRNEYGQLGLGTTIQMNTPTQVGSATNWSSVSCGELYTIAIKTDSTLWAWGDNGYSQLGLGTTIQMNTPTQIDSATNWSSVSCGGNHTIAIKTDGTLWAWGCNYSGQLGLGTTIQMNTPTQVGTLTNWSSVSCGRENTIAIKTDGTLWAWGWNNCGQLGLGTTIQMNTPTQVGSATNWSSVSGGGYHTIAIKTDGTLWSWGLNEYGQLGLGTTIQMNTPTQVGSATNWSSVSSGVHHTIAIKTDGTLWAWGDNYYGELGLGNSGGNWISYDDGIDRNTPTQVGTLTNWSSVSGGESHTLAIKSDGTLWAWGSNGDGQLGLGDTTNRTTPTQVNYSPTLSWTGEANYVSDGLDPETGVSTNTYTFRVKYTDADNDAPSTISVVILKGGTGISGSPFAMTAVDPGDTTYTDGKLYTYSTALSAGYDYTYYFVSYDVNLAAATGAPTSELKDAPDVALPPASWTTTAHTATGSFKWIKTYDRGSGYGEGGASAIIGSDGYLYVCGNIEPDTSGKADIALWKFDKDGNLQAGFPKSWDSGSGEDCAIDILEGKDGYLYLVGYSSSGIGVENLALWKYSKDGTLQSGYPKFYDCGGADFAVRMIQGAGTDDNLYIVGFSTPKATMYGIIPSMFDFALWKYDTSGNLASGFPKLWDGGGGVFGDLGYSIIQGADGYIYCGGYYYPTAEDNEDVVLWKYDTSGNLQAGFPKYYSGTVEDAPFGITQGSDGYLYLVGHTSPGDAISDAAVYKYDTSGNLQAGFPKIYTNSGNTKDSMVSAAFGPDGLLYIVGVIDRDAITACTDTDFALWIYDSSGTLKQSSVETFNQGRDDEGHKIINGGDGYLYAVGRSSGTGSDKDLLIVKISSSGAAVTTPAVTTPATTYYYIKGYVKDSGGTGISGVTVNCTGTSPYTTTSNGYYEFLNLTASGNYTITPSKTDYVFSPTDKSYTTLSANQSDQNFTGRKPLLSASVSSLDFGEVVIGNSKSLTFTITDSTSTGLLSGTISDDVNWITTDVTTFTGNSTVVTVTVNTTGLSKSQYSGTITLTSNGGNTSITVSVSATCVLTKPNPYNPRAGKVTFFGSGVVPNDTKIRIYTVSGDLVKTVNTTTTDSQGQPVLEWDGKNEDGDMVVSGVYIYVSESPKEKAHGKFTVIKK